MGSDNDRRVEGDRIRGSAERDRPVSGVPERELAAKDSGGGRSEPTNRTNDTRASQQAGSQAGSNLPVASEDLQQHRENVRRQAALLRQLTPSPMMLAFAMLSIALAASLGFNIALAQRVSVLRSAFVTDTTSISDLQSQEKTNHESVNHRLETLEQIEFGPKPPPATPSDIQVWQRNRDKELRDRITALEHWRLQEERK